MQPFNKFLSLSLTLFVLAGFTTSVWAADPPMSAPPAAPQASTSTTPPPPPNRFDHYYERISDKFDFGAVNVIIGWTEFFTEPVDHCKRKKGILPCVGSGMVGTGHGLVNGSLDMVGGTINMATSFLPQFQFPLPQGGVDLERVTA